MTAIFSRRRSFELHRRDRAVISEVEVNRFEPIAVAFAT